MTNLQLTKESLIQELNDSIELTAIEIEIEDELHHVFSNIANKNKTSKAIVLGEINDYNLDLSRFTDANKLDPKDIDESSTIALIIDHKYNLDHNYSNALIKTSSYFYKNLSSQGSIGICIDKSGMDNVLKIIGYNPPLINKLFISHECAIELINKLNCNQL